MKWRTLHFATLCLLFTVSWTNGATVSAAVLTTSLLSRRGSSESNDDIAATSSKKWTSFFSVDPSKILRVLVKRGGMLIPRSVEKELLALSSVLEVDAASLNLVERILMMRNFTVSVPGSKKESLRIGQVNVTWDSYIKPCVKIEMEEVYVSVEFSNMRLTRTNWYVF